MDGKRKWCPSGWLDEIVPVLVEDPSEALYQIAPGWWAMVCDDFRQAAATAPSDEYTVEIVYPGKRLNWSYTERRGTFTLTIAGDGSWTLDAPMPEQVTHWVLVGEFDPLGDSVEDLIRNAELEAGEHEVLAYYWSKPIPFDFRVEDGRGWFVPAVRGH